MVVPLKKKTSSLLPRKIKKILHELKKGLVEIYGEQLKAVYLFGSFARGEGKLPDSDIDVMIVLNGEFNHRDVEQRSVDFITSLCLEYDVVISWFFASNTKYAQSKMPFMTSVRKEAVTI
jgi:predicted nucleotidyltransferase